MEKITSLYLCRDSLNLVLLDLPLGIFGRRNCIKLNNQNNNKMTDNYIWANAHAPTQEQIDSLGGELEYLPVEIQGRINNCPSNPEELEQLAEELLEYVGNGVIVQPGGSPAFQFTIGALCAIDRVESGIMYAHSERVSEDVPQPDGSIRKVSIFKHLGWVTVW